MSDKDDVEPRAVLHELLEDMVMMDKEPLNEKCLACRKKIIQALKQIAGGKKQLEALLK